MQDFKVLVLGGALVSEPSTLDLVVMQYASSWEQIVFQGGFPISFTDLHVLLFFHYPSFSCSTHRQSVPWVPGEVICYFTIIKFT